MECVIICATYVVFFFFSSRRRHTRCGRDWSSDVCSSDLPRDGRHAGSRVAPVCGIVGFVLARPDGRPEQAVLKRMADRIAHRGPDDEGFVVRGPAALGVRRLRIIDLETGRQPMTGEDGTVWVPSTARSTTTASSRRG